MIFIIIESCFDLILDNPEMDLIHTLLAYTCAGLYVDIITFHA